MQARLGPSWEVINAGVLGFQFHQYYYHVREMLELQPDEIILGITLNDFTLLRTEFLDGDPRLPSTRPRELTPGNRLLFFVKFHSGLLNLHKLVDNYFWLTEPKDLVAFDEGQVYRLLDDPEALEYHLLVMKRFMTAIKQRCDEAGVPVRAVVFPYRFMFLPEERQKRPNWHEMTERIQLLMEDIGIPTLDPFEPLNRVVQAHGGNPRSVLLDHNHFDVLGHDALAEIIVRTMFIPGPLGAPIPPRQ
jgi:lysophospholipase L1-like esterase